jgi:hypothetical protein
VSAGPSAAAVRVAEALRAERRRRRRGQWVAWIGALPANASLIAGLQRRGFAAGRASAALWVCYFGLLAALIARAGLSRCPQCGRRERFRAPDPEAQRCPLCEPAPPGESSR